VWLCELCDQRSSNPEINELIKALTEELQEDLTYFDRLMRIHAKSNRHLKEDLAFLKSKYLESLVGASESSAQELYWKHQIDHLDTAARRLIILVPLILREETFVEFLQKRAKEAEHRSFRGKRASQQFTLLLAGRIWYWRGEVLKQIRKLEREGVIRWVDVHDSLFIKQLREANPRIEPECESVQPTPTELQSGPAADSGAGDRRTAVDAYIEEVFCATGKRITRTDIWKSARYKSRTEFERWERFDKRATKTADQRFTRILSEKPHLK
jgi:hypothetical protein